MRFCVIGLLAVLLVSCAAEETFETVADELIAEVSAPVREVSVELPQEAAAQSSVSDNGSLYLCDGYEITIQTFASGDLDATIRSVTGYGRDDLTVIETEKEGCKRSFLVWSCAGETGERIGKAVILDDGSHHYVLTVMADADRTREFEETWQALFESFTLE